MSGRSRNRSRSLSLSPNNSPIDLDTLIEHPLNIGREEGVSNLRVRLPPEPRNVILNSPAPNAPYLVYRPPPRTLPPPRPLTMRPPVVQVNNGSSPPIGPPGIGYNDDQMAALEDLRMREALEAEEARLAKVVRNYRRSRSGKKGGKRSRRKTRRRHR